MSFSGCECRVSAWNKTTSSWQWNSILCGTVNFQSPFYQAIKSVCLYGINSKLTWEKVYMQTMKANVNTPSGQMALRQRCINVMTLQWWRCSDDVAVTLMRLYLNVACPLVSYRSHLCRCLTFHIHVKQRGWPDSSDAQPNSGLRCPHMRLLPVLRNSYFTLKLIQA